MTAGARAGAESDTVTRAIRAVYDSFPFGEPAAKFRSDFRVATEILAKAPPPAAILDFGAGTCRRAAILAHCGYAVSACDDLSDRWHLEENNQQKIVQFAEAHGVSLSKLDGTEFPYRSSQFDVVLLNDVIEHLHDSPLALLSRVIDTIKPDGILLITVPNAANLRKRIDLLRGRTNYPPFRDFFWYPPPWRGHVREYVLQDLAELAEALGIETLELGGVHFWVEDRLKSSLTRAAYLALTALPLLDGLRDTWLLIGRKPANWRPPTLRRSNARESQE